MKANAPEKIFVHVKDDKVCNTWNNEWIGVNDIEYTHTDSFIEKACEWIKENLLKHTYVYEGEVGIGMAVFLEEFKQAMKEE